MPHHHIEGCPSVTEVLSVIRKPYLEYWRGKHGNAKCEKTLKKSNEIGTRVHDEISRLLTGLKPKTKRQNIREMVSNFNEQFIKPYEVRAISVEPEESLIDTTNNFHGTYDAIIELYPQLVFEQGQPQNKVVVIADWKTSNSIDSISWPLQLSAYAYLWNNETQNHINEGLVIRMDKKTLEIEGPIWYTNLDQYFEVFLSCRRLYDLVHKKGIWENKN